MSLVADAYVWIVKWHKDYQPDPHPQVGDIYSGLRAPSGGGFGGGGAEGEWESPSGKHVLSPCQYWVKGLPGICTNFAGNKCVLSYEEGATGYNGGFCDYLGRRSWCNKYTSSGDNLEEYICIAPDMFRTGLGKRDTSVTTHLVLLPYPIEEILGYNGGEGVGRCDGMGTGRSAAGEGITDLEEMYKLPVVCRHYKPWIMGFGAIEPRPMGTAVLTGGNIYDGSPSDPLFTLTRYLPFAFRIYNLRAQHQKCAYWDQDFGTDFEMDYSGGYASITLPEDPLTECTCTDEASTPYKIIIDDWPDHTSDTLMDVLTPENGIICNGAKPECPCYTGKWTFCVDDNMRDGMRITAEQIMELRFWTAVWQSKEVYDSIFAERSGTSDITTSDIFTFDKWEKLGTKVEDSIMKGKRIYQCFPVPLNKREFDPDVYLTKETIIYPKATAITGTSGSEKSFFPTLVRQIDAQGFVPYLNVVYPYSRRDPWGVTTCSDDSSEAGNMEIASCNLEVPATAIFGYTIRNRTVHALNINKIRSGGFLSAFENTKVAMLPEKERVSTNKNIKDLIESSIENIKYYGYVVSGVSDLYGYFGIGPLKLEYNTTTTIAVVCEYYPEEYEITILKVDTKFYGGSIVQDTFEYKYEELAEGSGYTPILPVAFGPEAKLSGHVEAFGGKVDLIFPIYNRYSYGIMNDTAYYSYCMNEYTAGGGTDRVEQWVMLGPTCYVFAEIDNINLSYMFDFEVIEAHMMPQSGAQTCGDASGSNVELEVIFPKADDSGAIKRDHILPNCVLLKSQNPFAFFNEDWSLFIKYKYKMLKDSKAVSGSATEEVVWPSNLDEEGSLNKFTSPLFSLEIEGTTFKVDGVHFGTIAIMAYIVDDNGRIQSAIATKMLCDIVTTRCRPVEISYSYRSDAIGYDLIPNSGFFTWRGGDKVLSGDYGHYRKAKCGDHDCNPDNCIGPMWFPFNNCTSMDFYSWYSGAASCTMPIEGQPRDDWRYCMADEYKAWVRAGNNWAAACGDGWYYSYSKAVGGNEFTGVSKIRTSVNLIEYSFMGWTPPPFGNDGREITERWLSQEHYSFWDLSGIEPTPRSEYMPLVFDDEMLFMSFNAFDEQGRIGPISDCLHTTCMLNCMLSNTISEVLTEDRYRFEELFTVINHALCMYPPPVYEGPGGSVTARRYGFKIDGVAWAWREYWKDIERNIDDKILLNFINLTRPDYYFDFEKTEHRLITEEGEPAIRFVAPVKEEGGSYTYPEVFIKGGVPRKFELIYDEYNEEQVDWVQDAPPLGSSVEGGGGEFGGAGVTGGWDLEIEGDTGEGEFDTNIYEKAMGDEWFHDVNTIFDVNASTEKLDIRKIVISKDVLLGDTYAWYNRGLIANIPRNRLIHLPYELSQESINAEQVSNDRDKDENGDEDQNSTWTNTGIFSDDIIFKYSGGSCITQVEINGKIGIYDGRTYCKPQITISEYGMDDDESEEYPPTVVYSSGGSSGSSFNEGVEDYNLEIGLSRSPKRVLHKSKLFQIKLTLPANQHLMLNSDSGILIWSGEYVDATESIKVWEQRYVTSTGEFGDKNPDGVDSKNLRSFDRDVKNAGQYFPTGINTSEQDEVKMCDKMTMVGASKQFQEDEDLEISIGNLKTIENEKQRELYEDSYNRDSYDTLTYSTILPPNVQQFIDEHGVTFDFSSGLCKFESEKLKFDDQEATTSFDQSAGFWQPGGHYFRWGDKYASTRCYILGPIETVYYPVAVHHKHGKDVLPWTPYEAYVGWSKLEYYEGKLDQAILLEKPIDTGYDWTGLIVRETST